MARLTQVCPSRSGVPSSLSLNDFRLKKAIKLCKSHLFGDSNAVGRLPQDRRWSDEGSDQNPELTSIRASDRIPLKICCIVGLCIVIAGVEQVDSWSCRGFFSRSFGEHLNLRNLRRFTLSRAMELLLKAPSSGLSFFSRSGMALFSTSDCKEFPYSQV